MLERHDRGRLDSHRDLAARLGSDLGYSALAPLEPWLGSLSFGGSTRVGIFEWLWRLTRLCVMLARRATPVFHRLKGP
jgi:hypothetical protein